MSFTRFHDDPIRIQKQLQESTYTGRYRLGTPGQGMDLPFIEDPNMRLQSWGANKRTNMVGLESDLFGLTRPLNRDLIDANDYKKNSVTTTTVQYKTMQPFVEESRASHPAWTYKDLEHSRWENPFINPQNNIEMQFNSNIQSRIIEKDKFIPVIPVIGGNVHTDYYLSGNSICMGNNCSSNL